MAFFDFAGSRLGIIQPGKSGGSVTPGGVGESFPVTQGKFVADTVEHWLEGPCPEGEIIGAIDLDNPLQYNEVTRHYIIKCLDSIAGDGGGGITPGGSGKSDGGILGPGQGRGGTYNPQFLPGQEKFDPYAYLPAAVRKKMKELSTSTGPCSLDLPENSDPLFPDREHASCTEEELNQLKMKIAVLLNSPFLDRFPGFKQCIENEFSELTVCCHTTFSDSTDAVPSYYNYNFSFTDGLDTQSDPALEDTIEFAKTEKILKLGTWFFRPENGFLSDWFLVRLFGALCPLGREDLPFSWFDAAMLLEPYPEYVICDLLSRIGAERIKKMQEVCTYGVFDKNTSYNFKFFAIDVCTGAVYLQPVPSSPGIPTPVTREDGSPITLGIMRREDQGKMFDFCHID